MFLLKRTQLIMPILLGALLSLTLVTSVHAVTPIDDTGEGCLSIGGEWNAKKLTCTLIADRFEGIEIVSDNITLDCAGYQMIGPGTGTGTGIYAREQLDVTIKNCIVRGYRTGISLLDCSNSTVEGNTVVDNSGSGIGLEGGPGAPSYYCRSNTVKGNTAVDNGSDGIVIGECDHITLTDNTANLNGGGGTNGPYSGIALYTVVDSRVERNNANANSLNGIDMWQAARIRVSGNNTDFNAHSGISIADGLSNTLVGNTSSFNLWFGIHLSFVYDSSLTSNETLSNKWGGINLGLCERNTVRGNTSNYNGHIDANGGYGFYDGYGDEEEGLLNTWVNNTCEGNYSGGSVHGNPPVFEFFGELCEPQY